jgi:hypothetical protein
LKTAVDYPNLFLGPPLRDIWHSARLLLSDSSRAGETGESVRSPAAIQGNEDESLPFESWTFAFSPPASAACHGTPRGSTTSVAPVRPQTAPDFRGVTVVMAGPIVTDAKALSIMVKTETRHGYESHVRAMLVRRGRDSAQRHEVQAGNLNGLPVTVTELPRPWTVRRLERTGTV